MFYTVYEIKNKINNKLYVGMHQTSNLDDGYMGSGKYIKRAIEKHGVENFEKRILFVFESYDEMVEKEKELVTSEFCDNNYNLCPGGKGGFGYIHSLPNSKEWKRKARSEADKKLEEKYGKNWRTVIAQLGNNSPNRKIRKLSEEQRIINIRNLNSNSSNEKRKDTFAKNGHQKGEKNANFGKCWIKRDKESRMIPKTELDKWIGLGYVKGR